MKELKILQEELAIARELEELLEAGLDNWTDESIAKFSKSIGISPDEKGFFDVCKKRMTGNDMSDKNASGFCAKIIDKSKGSTDWRGEHNESEIKCQLAKHIENGVSLTENVYRVGSKNYFQIFVEARKMFNSGVEFIKEDREILQSDIGSFGIYEGEEVPLDMPMMESDEELSEEKDVELNKPKRGGSKKFYVYVKDGDKIKKISFGDTTGLKLKYNDPEARKSFVARHDCENKKDKTTAGFWSCRIHRYWNSLNLAKPEGSFAYW
jgi:hypothetical protein